MSIRWFVFYCINTDNDLSFNLYFFKQFKPKSRLRNKFSKFLEGPDIKTTFLPNFEMVFKKKLYFYIIEHRWISSKFIILTVLGPKLIVYKFNFALYHTNMVIEAQVHLCAFRISNKLNDLSFWLSLKFTSISSLILKVKN